MHTEEYDDSAEYNLPSIKYNRDIVSRVEKLWAKIYNGGMAPDLQKVSTLVDIVWYDSSESKRSRKQRIAEDVYQMYIITDMMEKMLAEESRTNS